IMSEGDELDALDLDDNSKPGTSMPAIEAAANGKLSVPYTSDFRDDRREFERRYIARCLEESGGNVTRAASILGMHRQSLQHKLRELGLGRRYVAVGCALFTFFVLDLIGRIDTVRALLDRQNPHWAIKGIAHMGTIPYLPYALGFACLMAFGWAIYEARRRPLTSTSEPQPKPNIV